MHRGLLVSFLSLLAAMPSSTNYTLKSYDMSGGAGNGTSTNYGVQGELGSSGGSLSGTTFALPAGVKASTTVPVPTAPTLIDSNNAYDRLLLTLTVTSFPTDTKYLIAVSTDNFVTTKYVQTDDTIGSSLAIADYQTHAAWGGASGFSILGLLSNTTYKVKVAALQGSGTGSSFSPTASATTAQPSVTFGLSTSLTPTPPFTTAFTSLIPGQVVGGTATVSLSLTTNAANGGTILVRDQSSGLLSTIKSFTLSSSTADLSVAAKGYGTQVTAVSQTSGGPLSATSPYNGTGNAVGALTSVWQPLASFNSPITSGTLTAAFLAKSDITVPITSDYADTVTIGLAPLF